MAVQSVEHYMNIVFEQIPTRPMGAKGRPDIEGLEPWYVNSVNGNLQVTVPSDLESYSDDPGVIAAIAATKVLKAKIVVGLPMDNPQQWVRCHKDCDQYFYGIAAALREGNVDLFPNYSGWFGKGYNLVKHGALVNQNLRPWLLRGSAEPLRKIFAYKKWGEKLPNGWKHFEVLLRYASQSLQPLGQAATWLVPLNSLKGTKIKKTLLCQKIGFLLQTDVDALNIRFKDQLDDFRNFQTNYKEMTLQEAISLEDRLLEINQGLKIVEMVAARIIDHRASVLYPKVEKNRKKSKIPLKERMRHVELEDFINHFNPSTACGIIPFTVTKDISQDEITLNIFHQISDDFRKYARNYPAWEDLLLAWWNTEVNPRAQFL